MEDYLKYMSILQDPSYAFGFLNSMIRDIEMSKQQKLDAEMGIEKSIQGLYGCPSKNIPFQFFYIHYVNNRYICKSENLKSIYDSEGNFLFSGNKFCALSDDLFIVYQYDEKKERCAEYGALYKGDEKISKDIFRQYSEYTFGKSDFCAVFMKVGDVSKSVIINKEGEIVFDCGKSYRSPYVKGNILMYEDNLYNLFTSELICKKDYHSSLETDEHIFVQSDKQVFKINIMTCEFEVFGKPKEVKEKVKPTPQPKEEKSLPEPKQRRNDICKCGSGKKYKYCCGQ